MGVGWGLNRGKMLQSLCFWRNRRAMVHEGPFTLVSPQGLSMGRSAFVKEISK